MIVLNRTKYVEIGRKMRETPQEKPCASYEWEELVQRMCASDDAWLRGIGVREMEIMRRNSGGGRRSMPDGSSGTP